MGPLVPLTSFRDWEQACSVRIIGAGNGQRVRIDFVLGKELVDRCRRSALGSATLLFCAAEISGSPVVSGRCPVTFATSPADRSLRVVELRSLQVA